MLRMADLRCVANPGEAFVFELAGALGRRCPIRAGRTVRLNLLGSTAQDNAKLARPGRLAVNQSGSRCSQSERPVQPHPRARSIVVPRDVDHALSNWVKGLRRSLARTVSDRGVAPPHWQEGFFDHVMCSGSRLRRSGSMFVATQSGQDFSLNLMPGRSKAKSRRFASIDIHLSVDFGGVATAEIPAIATSPQNRKEIGGEHRRDISIVFALLFRFG